MGQMFRSFVAVFVGGFAVLAKLMLSLENLADVAVATSGQFKDDAEKDRKVSREEADLARAKRAEAIKRAKAAQAAQQNPTNNP